MRGAPTAAAAARLAVLAGAMMITAVAFHVCHPPKHRRSGIFVRSPSSWLPPERLQLLLPHQPTVRTTAMHPTSSNLARGGGRGPLRGRWPFGGGGDKEKEEEDAGVVGGSSGGSDDGSAAAEDSTAVRETPLPPPVAAAPNLVEVAPTAEESVPSNASGGGGGGEGAGVAVTTSKTRRAGTKSMAAARAAVAVMERIEEQEQEEEGKGGGGGVSARRRRAKTTREEMFNICVQDRNMTETEGTAAVQTYVYALAATLLVSQQDKEDLILAVDEKRLAMLSKNETSSLAAEATPKATAATATRTYKSEWYEEEPPSVYDDDLLRDLGNRFPLVAKEVDEVLLSKPESTGFSSRVLNGFREWITFTPKIMEMAEKTPFGTLTTAKVFGARTAFSAVADVLRADTVELANGGRGRGEADSVIRQMQANAAEELLSGGMGFPKRRLVVRDEDVELFVEQVLAGLVVVGETLTTSIGFRLIRCNYVKSSTEAAELSRTVKSRMAEMGLDAKVAAFLTWDVIGAFDSMENMGREIEDLESQAAMMGDDDEQMARVFNTIGAGLSLMGPQDEKMFVLIPAETKPNEDTQANEQGRTALALGAPITLFAFLGDVFNGSPYEVANGAADGDVQLLTQIGLLGLVMAGLLLSRDIARTVAAKLVGVELEAPVLLPSFETGLLATKRPVASFPSTGQDLFDVAIAGPTVGFATAAAALVMGLQMTAAAGPDVLAGFPSLPSSLLQCSSLVGSVVDYFLHTNLAVQDLAVERVAMHPLAVGGVAGMLWTAATVLPLPGSDGEAVIDTLDTNFKYNAIVTPLAYLFAVSEIIGGGMFLLSVLLVNFIAYPESAPLMREDNVTPVRSPARLALGVIVAAVSLAVLSPMTISSFLTGGPLSMDTGAGAESVAAGLGVGGIGFHGFL